MALNDYTQKCTAGLFSRKSFLFRCAWTCALHHSHFMYCQNLCILICFTMGRDSRTIWEEIFRKQWLGSKYVILNQFLPKLHCFTERRVFVFSSGNEFNVEWGSHDGCQVSDVNWKRSVHPMDASDYPWEIHLIRQNLVWGDNENLRKYNGKVGMN